jgi:hypothetical protein
MLRDQLQQITDNNDVSLHERLIGALRPQFPHAIRKLNIDPRWPCNCVSYACNLVGDQDYENVFRRGKFAADTAFVPFLIARGGIVQQPDPAPELLAVYFAGDQVKHIGRVRSNGVVVSKWGVGNLYEHPTLEVPSSYGDHVRYFSDISTDDAWNNFVEYVQSKGASLLRPDETTP